jgi:hypothetical protein
VRCFCRNALDAGVAADDGGDCAGAAIASSKKLRLHGE